MKKMNHLIMAGVVCAVAACQPVAPLAADELVPLKTEMPKPLIVGTPVPINIPNVEQPPQGKRPDFMVPAGSVNLAKGKKVTSSDSEPVVGELSLITDGDKAGDEGSYVELSTGKQWVQIDLGQPCNVYAILLWHFHSQKRVYHDVVIQVAEDADFLTGVKTIFNNDTDNSSGLGVGKNRPYIEDWQGKLIDATGVKGRYVRLYSKGNTSNQMNHYIEVEVWGKPAK